MACRTGSQQLLDEEDGSEKETPFRRFSPGPTTSCSDGGDKPQEECAIFGLDTPLTIYPPFFEIRKKCFFTVTFYLSKCWYFF